MLAFAQGMQIPKPTPGLFPNRAAGKKLFATDLCNVMLPTCAVGVFSTFLAAPVAELYGLPEDNLSRGRLARFPVFEYRIPFMRYREMQRTYGIREQAGAEKKCSSSKNMFANSAREGESNFEDERTIDVDVGQFAKRVLSATLFLI